MQHALISSLFEVQACQSGRRLRNLGFVLAMLLARQLSYRSLLVFYVDRSHASSSGKLINVASTFSAVVQSRLLDIAE